MQPRTLTGGTDQDEGERPQIIIIGFVCASAVASLGREKCWVGTTKVTQPAEINYPLETIQVQRRPVLYF
jgi:hypothetical protein